MRLFTRRSVLPPTRYGYQPPPEAVGLRWICTHEDCGRGGPDFADEPWPRRCPGCRRDTVATHLLAEPWQHAARRVEIDARLGPSPGYFDPAAARAEDLLWQAEEALRLGDRARAEQVRVRLDELVESQEAAGRFTGYSQRRGLVVAALKHGDEDLAVRELAAWYAVKTYTDLEDNGERADCRTLAGLLIAFLEEPAASRSRHREQVWRLLRELMPRIEEVATADNLTGYQRLLRVFAGGNTEEEALTDDLLRLAEADADSAMPPGTPPARTGRRMEILGRHTFAGPSSGIDGGLLWDVCLAPFRDVPKRTLADAALASGDWAVYGASRCFQDLHGHDPGDPDYLRVLDAALLFLHESGVSAGHLNGYDLSRWAETHGPGTW